METLSDKIQNNVAGECVRNRAFDSLPAKDVKEFIRLLKDIDAMRPKTQLCEATLKKICKGSFTTAWNIAAFYVLKRIDKLAGDKLI